MGFLGHLTFHDLDRAYFVHFRYLDLYCDVVHLQVQYTGNGTAFPVRLVYRRFVVANTDRPYDQDTENTVHPVDCIGAGHASYDRDYGYRNLDPVLRFWTKPRNGFAAVELFPLAHRHAADLLHPDPIHQGLVYPSLQTLALSGNR